MTKIQTVSAALLLASLSASSLAFAQSSAAAQAARLQRLKAQQAAVLARVKAAQAAGTTTAAPTAPPPVVVPPPTATVAPTAVVAPTATVAPKPTAAASASAAPAASGSAAPAASAVPLATSLALDLDALKKTRADRRHTEVVDLEQRWGTLASDPRAAVELKLHAQRSAYLQRIRALGEKASDATFVKGVDALITKEDSRDADALNALRSGALPVGTAAAVAPATTGASK